MKSQLWGSKVCAALRRAQKWVAAALGAAAFFAVGTASAASVAKVGDAEYETLEAALAAVQDGGTIMLVDDVTVDTAIIAYKQPPKASCPTVASYTLDLNGKTLYASAEVNLNMGNDAQTVTVKNGKFHATGYSGRFRANDKATVTIENVAFTTDGYTPTAGTLAGVTQGTCVFQGYGKSENAYTFKDCTFTDCYVSIEGGGSTEPSNDVDFINCRFKLTGEKYIENAVTVNYYVAGALDFSGCTFDVKNFAKNSSTVRNVTVIDCDSTAASGLSITLDDTTVTGTTNEKGGSVSLIDVAGKSTTTVALTGTTSVTVDGTKVESPVSGVVAKVGDTQYFTLADALNAAVAANGDCTVEIVDDITFAEGASWETIAIGKNKTLVINGNGKTVTGLPQCLFGAMGDSQYGSKFTMTNLKFVKPKASCFAATGKSAAGVILGVAYGMDVTIENVVIEGADVRGGNDSYVAGFIGWCNGTPSGLPPELAKKTVKLTNCAIRNSTLVSCGSAAGLVAYTTATPNEAVTLVVENCEVTGNTIVGTEIKDGKPRTDIVGAVIGTVGAGGASVAAKVTGNSVYGSNSAFDAETLTKDAEVTTIYGRNASGGTLTLTGGTYDNAPIAENVEWATVAEGFELKQGADGTYAVSEAKYVAQIGEKKYSSLAAAIEAALALNDGTPVEIIDDIIFAEGDTWTPIAYDKGGAHRLVVNGNGHKIVNLPNAMFERAERGYYLRMSSLTFENPVVNSDGDAAVIIGYAESVDELMFTDVTIRGAKVTGGNYAAGFVGYAALDAGNLAATYTRCEVSGSTITGGGSAGAIMGHANGADRGSVSVVDCVVKNNAITCTEAGKTQPGKTKAGAVFGTVGASDTFVKAEVSGNTVISGGASIDAGGVAVTTIYGRLGTEGGTLTLTGGTYDNAPFAEADASWAGVSSSCAISSTTVGGKTVYTVAESAVAKVGETEYASLATAIEAALTLNDGTPVEILRDVTFAKGDTWTAPIFGGIIGRKLVINGNGKTIANLPGCFLWADNYDSIPANCVLEMDNLTFKNPTVHNVGDDAAVILGCTLQMSKIAFRNVVIDGANVSNAGDHFTGGFLGYCNGSGSEPALEVSFVGCAIRNSLIVGGAATAALIAHTGGESKVNVRIVDTEVVDNVIVTTELKDGQPRAEKVGAAIGTLGGTFTEFSAKVTGNTVYAGYGTTDDADDTNWKSGVAVTTIYGRHQGVTSDGRNLGTLTLTGGTYDYRPFAETDSSWAAVAEGCALAGNDEDGWKVESFIKANGVAYSTLEAAFAAAEPDADGVVTYEIGGKATVDGEGWVQILKSGLTGVKEVKFVGTSDDAEICLVTKGSILADQSYDVNVSFEGLTLTRQNPEYVNDIGFGACYFSTWLRNVNAAENSVTYTRCKFPNGVCNNQYGKTFFNDCTFCNEASGGTTGNNLWVYDGEVEVNGGTFTGNRGVKVYNEGDAKDGISVKIAGATFDGLTEKSAILVSKPSAVTVSDVTVKDCAKGLITRDISGDDEAAVSANGTGISGTFAISSDASAAAAKKDFNLTGGTFTAAVDADYCAKDYEVTANDDGTYGVTSHTVAKVGDNEFNSLAEALKFALNANDGVNFTTVEIVDDITFDEGDTWEPGAFVKVLNKIEVKGVGERKTITGMPGPLFANFDVTGVDPFGSSIRVSNIKFVNTKVSETAQGGDEKYGFGSVILGYAYGFKELTVEGVEIENADVRVHGSGDDSCYAAGFFAWCTGSDDGLVEEVTVRNCAIRNSTIVSYGTAGGVIGYMSNSKYVKVTIENVEVNGNTIVGTEIKNGAPRTDVIGSVIGSVAPGGASVSATVKDNSVYGTLSAIDAETLTKDTDEVTTIYGRGVGSASLLITGGEYDNAPFAEADASWAKVAEWSKIVEQDGVYKVVDSPVTLGNVAARQRYPWNGLVDVTFELKSNKSVRLFIVAEYANGDETVRLPMAAAKLVNEDGTQSDVNVSDGSFTVAAQETAKTIHVVWDSTSAVPARQSGVTFKVYAK